MKRVMGLTLLLLLTTLPVFGRGSHSHYSTRGTRGGTACCSRSRSDVHVYGYTRRTEPLFIPTTAHMRTVRNEIIFQHRGMSTRTPEREERKKRHTKEVDAPYAVGRLLIPTLERTL